MSSPRRAYSVRVAAPEESHAKLLELWRRNLVLDRSAAEKFAWLYRDAPNPAPSVLLLCNEAHGTRAGPSGEIVGCAGYGVRELWVGGRLLRAGLLSDLAVDEAHRSLLPALQLVRELKEQVSARFELAYGLPNHAAEGVLRRVGYREIGRMQRYARLLRHGAHVEQLAERLRIAWRPIQVADDLRLSRAAGAAFDLARIGVDRVHAIRHWSRFRLGWIDRADARFDQLWREARRHYPFVGQRDAALLNWRFARGTSQLATLIGRADGKLQAYALVEQREGVAHLRDLFGYPEAMAPLLDMLIPALYRQGCLSISVRVFGATDVVRLLKDRGFRPRETGHMIALDLGSGVPTTLLNPHCWHLFDLDEDV